jgi:chaperone modulatory protein CbpM
MSALAARTFVLARRPQLRLDVFAERSGLHPDLLCRFVALGVLDAQRDPNGDLWFEPATLDTAAKARRLRAGLGLNYASLGLVLDLLARIDELEKANRRRRSAPWTPVA